MSANQEFKGLHSAGSPDWMTPRYLIEAARWVMGGIDLDPASDARANARVKAAKFYTAAENGLDPANPWSGRIFLNPPGGLVVEFWERLIREALEHPDDLQAVWIGFSLQQLQTLQSSDASSHPINLPMCIPSARVQFAENGTKRAQRLRKLLEAGEAPGANEHARKVAEKIRAGKPPKSAPSHANYITYIGPNVDRFVDAFAQFGVVRA